MDSKVLTAELTASSSVRVSSNTGLACCAREQGGMQGAWDAGCMAVQ